MPEDKLNDPFYTEFAQSILRKLASANDVSFEQLTAELESPADPAIVRRNQAYLGGRKLLFGMTKPWINPVKDMVSSVNRALHLHGVTELLAIAESANPAQDDPNRCGEVRLDAKDGWKVIFHYGADGHLRYISEFVTPAGQTIDFWEWDDEVPGRDKLIAWCSVGDAARLTAS